VRGAGLAVFYGDLDSPLAGRKPLPRRELALLLVSRIESFFFAFFARSFLRARNKRRRRGGGGNGHPPTPMDRAPPSRVLLPEPELSGPEKPERFAYNQALTRMIFVAVGVGILSMKYLCCSGNSYGHEIAACATLL
jgi:hypothetical protein